MHLEMFDIDGTSLNSYKLGEEYYLKAVPIFWGAGIFSAGAIKNIQGSLEF